MRYGVISSIDGTKDKGVNFQSKTKDKHGTGATSLEQIKYKYKYKWLEWMKQIIEGGKVGIGEDGQFFNTYKGLRQGDPLSPLLFNLVSDALATMFDNAKLTGQIRGLVPHLIEGGLTHLQYADDTIVFLNHDDQSIYNTKFLLYCFENMSGLKINYEKSEVFVLGCSDEEKKSGCNV
jgi:hypothetical protein